MVSSLIMQARAPQKERTTLQHERKGFCRCSRQRSQCEMHALGPEQVIDCSHEAGCGCSSPDVCWEGVGLTVDALWGHVCHSTSEGVALQSKHGVMPTCQKTFPVEVSIALMCHHRVSVCFDIRNLEAMHCISTRLVMLQHCELRSVCTFLMRGLAALSLSACLSTQQITLAQDAFTR